jgi:hypothetical protein
MACSSYLPAATLLSLALSCFAGSSRGRLAGVVTDRRGAYKAWDYNLSVFEERAEALFRRGPSGQQQEIKQRLAYCRRLAAAEFKALAELVENRKNLSETREGRGEQDPRGKVFLAAVASFEAYSGLFEEALHRAQGIYPSSHYGRLLRRWKKNPRKRLRRLAEAAFQETVEGFVLRVSALMEVRRRRLYDAVRRLQFSDFALDFRRQAQFDRVFFSLQASYAEQLEPELGKPVYREFPVGSPFDAEITLQPSAWALEQAPLEFPRGRTPEKETLLSGPTGSPGFLDREAYRVQEYHDLEVRFRKAQAGKQPEGLSKLWNAYVALRQRWFHIPERPRSDR